MTLLSVPLMLALLCAPIKEKKSEVAVAKEKNVEVLMFMGDVDESNVATMLGAMMEIANQKEKPRALIIEIHSPGGLVDVGFKLAKMIEIYPIPVHCIADRMALSMAFFILQSCDVRVMTKRATLLAHAPSRGTPNGSIGEQEENLRHLRRLNEAMMEHIVRKMKIPYAELAKRTDHRDWIMGWREALQVGAVDEVVDSTLNYIESL